MVLHPLYSAADSDFDFCLLRLNEPVSIPSLPLLSVNTNNTFPSQEGDMLTAIGHGLINSDNSGSISDQTLFVNKPYVSNTECTYLYPWFDTNSMLCAGGDAGEGTCSGDSGGPLVKDYGDRHLLVGVVSWGTTLGCGLEGLPGGFGKVSAAVPWMLQNACPWENNGMDFCSASTGPGNDECQDATDLGPMGWSESRTSFGSTVGAVDTQFGPGAWYKFEATVNSTANVSLCGSSYDTFLFVSKGSTCAELELEGQNDDSSFCGLASQLQFDIIAGETYFLFISGVRGAVGDYILSVSTGYVASCILEEVPDAVLIINTDRWPAETTWNIMQDESVVASGGPYSSPFTQHIHEFCFPGEGVYQFTILDSYQDGICCTQGIGNYTLSVGENEFVGGEFIASESHSFEFGILEASSVS